MIKNLDFTYIGKKSQLQGELIFDGETKMAGTLQGQLTMVNKEKLTIEIGGKISGILKVHDIDIYGSFEGELTATGKICLFPTANVEGKIIGKKLEVYPGANLNMTGHTTDHL